MSSTNRSLSNSIRIKGHVGKVSVRNEGRANEFVTLSVCSKEWVGTNSDGSPKYQQTWFNASAYRDMAKRVKNAGVKKGDLLYVDGSMRQEEYTRDNQTRKTWNLIVGEFDIARRADGKETAA